MIFTTAVVNDGHLLVVVSRDACVTSDVRMRGSEDVELLEFERCTCHMNVTCQCLRRGGAERLVAATAWLAIDVSQRVLGAPPTGHQSLEVRLELGMD